MDFHKDWVVCSYMRRVLSVLGITTRPDFKWEEIICRDPRMLVLAGLPGSGKSTFAQKYVDKYGWVRINQDELGSRKACINAAIDALKSGKSVMIDRCNFNITQRRVWIDIGRQYNASRIDCIWLDVAARECIDRASKRTDHPTILNSDDAKRAVKRMRGDFIRPTEDEGFDLVIRY